MSHFWALLVSIEHYANANAGWPPVSGAHVDGRNTFNYLTQDLRVPADHIIHLKDDGARRSNIIATFKSHLIDNSRIQKGDAILFHFSGHGSYLKAPAGWTVIEEKTGDERQDDLLEVIVPWDDGVIDRETGFPTCSIPDRTLAALINKAATAHGNNITVVLDCCCSGHGTRGGAGDRRDDDDEVLVPRTVDPSLLSPLYTELDDDLGVRSPPVVSKTSRARIKALDADHVLMAACGSREMAMGGERFGGVFTREWLDALRRNDIYPRTYAEILKVIDANLDTLRRKRGIDQHPQCDGIVRDRLIFKETMMRADLFDAVPIVCLDVTGNTVEITAGEVHGIGIGTLFELHIMDRNLRSQRMVGTAIVRRVKGTTCIAELPEGIILTAPKYMALIALPPESLRYVVAYDDSPSQQAARSINLFREGMSRLNSQDTRGIYEVRRKEEAELQLYFEADGSLTIYRLDQFLGSVRNRPPHLSPAEVEQAEFANILSAMARFNRLLALTSVTHPFADKVTFELLHLVKQSDSRADDEGFFIREVDASVEITDNEAILEQPPDKRYEDYAIVLRNYLPKKLFVQIWWFDPNTYGIAPCYISADASQPTLAGNGGVLQIGASTERGEPIQFELPEGATSDTIFVKVLLTERPTRLDFMRQDDMIGSDLDGVSFILGHKKRRMDDGEAEAKGEWDILLRKITIVESQQR
ncbi:hypothetical protein BDY19DRAFT_717273 [Irpex rosettiformis]|uniref:Uncharacterized protein n=1 Tax=Irpex rosettiformis TaxID=378272 RepID=A0ACB8U8L6_9APHY|nr:hypothetical protein BDY19DRAFT_717273 [Irpex rosettiformis]